MPETTTRPAWVTALAERLVAEGIAWDLVHDSIRYRCERGHRERYFVTYHDADHGVRHCAHWNDDGVRCAAPVIAEDGEPKDLTDPTVIGPIAEAWRLQNPAHREWGMTSASVTRESPATGTLSDSSPNATGSAWVVPAQDELDNPGEGLARALAASYGVEVSGDA